jgi:hypothetical protein
MKDLILSDEQKERIRSIAADLKIQAMMFDLDVDWESLELTPKRTDTQPFWVKNWKDKLNESDYMTDGSDDQEYDNER